MFQPLVFLAFCTLVFAQEPYVKYWHNWVSDFDNETHLTLCNMSSNWVKHTFGPGQPPIFTNSLPFDSSLTWLDLFLLSFCYFSLFFCSSVSFVLTQSLTSLVFSVLSFLFLLFLFFLLLSRFFFLVCLCLFWFLVVFLMSGRFWTPAHWNPPEWHANPVRQIGIWFQGEMRFEASDGSGFFSFFFFVRYFFCVPF